MQRTLTAAFGWSPRRGFSLLELTLVVAIIATLAAIAVPRYDRALNRHRVDMAARRIETDFELARTRAVALSASQTVVFDVAATSNSYQVTGMMDPDRSNTIYTVRLDNDPYGVTIVSADFGGDAVIVFNGHGMPDTGGTVVLRSGDHEGQVDVASPLIGVAVE